MGLRERAGEGMTWGEGGGTSPRHSDSDADMYFFFILFYCTNE